jgi:electron transfer flavoprotein alpha subunit
MATTLLISFGPGDAEASAGLASKLGGETTLLSLTGAAASGKANVQLSTGWNEVPPADNIAASIAELARGFDYVVAASSMAAKDLLARIAGILDAPCASDVIGIESANTFLRPVSAGAAIETVQLTGSPIVFTFRPSAFPGIAEDLPAATPVEIPTVSGSRRLSGASGAVGRPDLSQAKVVVSGGRPLQTADNFEKIIGGLADVLGGAVGATRAAVDSGIAANELQVGQTGKIVAPNLYIAAGISGSTQHMAGIKDSKVIVAINRDSAAPIFDYADFGLVADLFEAVPALTQRLKDA